MISTPLMATAPYHAQIRRRQSPAATTSGPTPGTVKDQARNSELGKGGALQ